MRMKEYQIGKMIFDKEKMKDTGFERGENYTYYGEEHTDTNTGVMYVRPDGTSDGYTQTIFPSQFSQPRDFLES